MHAAGQRLADNITEQEYAAGYRVSDFGIASKSEPVRLPGLHCHAPTITARADIPGEATDLPRPHLGPKADQAVWR